MERDFIQREGFEGFGELPDDLRGAGSISLPDGTYIPGMEADSYSTSGGAYRTFMEPIPGALTNPVSFTAVNYLPRSNFESFRSQRFIWYGTALIPPNPAVYVPLFINPATITTTSPQRSSAGVLLVPVGYAAVITGIRQWVSDSSAYQKNDGEPDDITWRVEAGSTSIFSLGNFPVLMSTMSEEARLFSIVNESTTMQLSVRNSTSGPLARSIAVQAVLTGHWFPIDEMDDVFRNK
jgi:hypothetical protein